MTRILKAPHWVQLVTNAPPRPCTQQDIQKFLSKVEHMAQDSQTKCAEILIDQDVDLETLSTLGVEHGGDEMLRQFVRTPKSSANSYLLAAPCLCLSRNERERQGPWWSACVLAQQLHAHMRWVWRRASCNGEARLTSTCSCAWMGLQSTHTRYHTQGITAIGARRRLLKAIDGMPRMWKPTFYAYQVCLSARVRENPPHPQSVAPALYHAHFLHFWHQVWHQVSREL
jgi:hypothetical protein